MISDIDLIKKKDVKINELKTVIFEAFLLLINQLE